MVVFQNHPLLTAVVLICFTFTCNYCEAGWIYDLNKAQCATFFTKNNYEGYNMSILNMKAFTDLSNFNLKAKTPNLHEKTSASETWNNQISSIIVEKDCRLRICLDTHLEGNCIWIKNSTAALDSVKMSI